MRGAPLRLRAVLSLLTIGLACLSLLVAVALVVLTTRLSATNEELGRAVESVRHAKDIQIDLMLYGRARSASVRGALDSDLRAQIAAMHPFVTGADETALLRGAETALRAYLAAETLEAPERVRDLQQTAFAALADLVELNVQQARQAHRAATRLDDIADVTGLLLALSVLVVVGGTLWWLWRQAFRPMFALGHAMERFGRGDLDARADPTGPAEIAEMVGYFNEMADSLAEQRHAQVASLGGIAHDMRNPLSTIQLAAAQLSSDPRVPPDAPARRCIAVVRRQVVHLDRMIGDLLDASKIEAGELDVQLEMRDMVSVVREASASLLEASPRHRVVLELPEHPLVIPCDPTRIEQVVFNLVSNAIKYSPEGGTVKVSLRLDEAEAVLEVADEGMGISQADRQRMFAPFRRFEHGGARIRGTGLGLFIVRSVVNAHGGRIEVESEVGRGSVFRVRLPATIAPAEPRLRLAAAHR